MTTHRTGEDLDVDASEKRKRIRVAIESEVEVLWDALAAIVGAIERGSSRDRRAQRVEEVLGEVVLRALARPDTYQAGRPVVPWLVGIARNVLRGEARDAATRPRRAEVDDGTWERLIGIFGPGDGLAAARIDVESMMDRLSPSARLALECRFWRGLDGAELTEAIGAPSNGAARVRVARALQSLRDLFSQDTAEVAR